MSSKRVRGSLEQRLFEAYQDNTGVTLSRTDVLDLIQDDAVSTRISNAAAVEAGVAEPGEAAIFNMGVETWNEFKRRLIRNSG